MMVEHCFAINPSGNSRNNQGWRPQPPHEGERSMAQNHYVTKSKRRNKNPKRKDSSQKTMAALREHAAAEKKSSQSAK